MRLRFWLWAMDASHAVYRFALRRASALTDWGEGEKLGEEPPWKN